MYNRNYGEFEYVRINSELLKAVLNRKTELKTHSWRLYETVVNHITKAS